MRNLLTTELFRWKKSIYLHITLVISLISGIFCSIISKRDYGFDSFFLFPLFIASCAIIPMIIGSDYSSGTIRNKIINGKTRFQIYLSHLLISFLFGLIIEVVFWLAFIIINPTYFTLILSIIPSMILCLSSVVSFCIMVSLLCTNRSVALIITVSIFLLSTVIQVAIDNKINQPEYYEFEHVNEDGSIEQKKEKNENYLSGFPRSFLEITNKTLSNYQLQEVDVIMYIHKMDDVKLRDYEDDSWKYFPVYSIGKIIGFSTIGYLIFRKKNIK